MYAVETGIPEEHRRAAAELYWEAFGRKLEHALGPRDRGVTLIERRLNLERAVVALQDRELLGLAGFHLDGRPLVGVSFGDVFREFGPFPAIWRSVLLALLDRKPGADELLMDGIVVREDQRGRGIGTALLRAVVSIAADNDKASVRLDVVDTNPRARALYEREGFVATKTERTPYLRKLMGFGASTEMVCDVARPV